MIPESTEADEPRRHVLPDYGIYAFEYEREHRAVNGWLRSFDPEAHEGHGWAVFTQDTALAMRFPSPATAAQYLLTIPASRPTRDDGAPNRPLRAFTVEIRALPA